METNQLYAYETTTHRGALRTTGARGARFTFPPVALDLEA